MILLPCLTVNFVKSNAAMAICFILFFAVNPLYSVFLGIYSGKNLKERWTLPLLNSVLFVLGTWIFFDMGEKAFVIYAIAYLIIAALSALLSALISRKSTLVN